MEKRVIADDNNLSVKPNVRLKYNFLTKEILFDLYINKQLSTVDISKIYNINRSTITKYLCSYGIKLRSSGAAGAAKVIKANIDNNFFEEINTFNSSYISGFILGDGTISKSGVYIALSILDKQIIYDIANELNASNYISIKKSKSNDNDKILLTLKRVKITNDLLANGFPLSPKSSKEKFINFNNNDLTWNFIRGMFDADGCIRIYNRTQNNKIYRKYKLSITTGEHFCIGLKNFIESNYNITLPNKCVHKKKNENVFVFEVSSYNVIKIFKDNMYKYDSIYLKRKKDIFDTL